MNAHAYASAFFKGESYEKLKKLLVCVSLVVMVIVYPTVMNISCRPIKHYVNFLFTICSYFRAAPPETAGSSPWSDCCNQRSP